MSEKRQKIGKILASNENILGLSFTDNSIYCALSSNSKSNSPSIIVEHSIPSGLIVNGEIINNIEISKMLKGIISEFKERISFCNISIPSTLIYSNIFHVPIEATKDGSLPKVIELMLKVELPWGDNKSYTDYIDYIRENDVLVCVFSTLQSIVNKYISVTESAGLKVMAVEFDALSILRLMKKNPNASLSITVSDDNVSIIITKEDKINFIFPIKMGKDFTKKSIFTEMKRIKNYYTNETGETIDVEETKLELEERSITLLGKNVENISTYPALGASIRNEFLNLKDKHISFLHIKPNELINYYRHISSIKVIGRLIFFISVILVLVHTIFFYVLSSIAEEKSTLSSKPPAIYSSVLSIEEETKKLSEVTAMSKNISDQIQRVLPSLLTVDSLFTDGIYIGSIRIQDIKNTISISGLAIDRNQYNAFRKSLSDKTGVTVANFPLGNLNTNTNIPFSATLYVKTNN